MQTIAALSAAVLALAPAVLADNCQTGLYYCGSSLYKKGDYNFIVNQCLTDNYQTVGSGTEDNTLFLCVTASSGYPGYIRYNKYCENGCVDGGKDRNDYCA